MAWFKCLIFIIVGFSFAEQVVKVWCCVAIYARIRSESVNPEGYRVVEGDGEDFASTYRAAVVEYAAVASSSSIEENIQENVLKYVSYIKEAARQGADIIVFPESTFNDGFSADRNDTISQAFFLPDPSEESSPCDSTPAELHQALIVLSCQAKSSKIYVVINVSEKRTCPDGSDPRPCSKDGYNLYNSNIVFDRNGRLISRYRKTHLFGQKIFNTTAAPEVETFTTDFNVTFGHLICFDLMFEQPAARLLEERGVRNIIAPMMWYSELPFLTSLQYQQSWAFSHNVNLLVAGADNPASGSGGSGMYSGKHGAVSAFLTGRSDERLLIASLDGDLSTDEPRITINIESREPQGMRMLRDHLDSYSWKPLDVSDQKENAVDICHDAFCCRIVTITSFKNGGPRDESYTYMAVAFDGVRTFSGMATAGVQTCGVIACIGADIASCGKMNKTSPTEIDIEFKKISIFGNFRKIDTIQLPVSLKMNLLPLDSNHLHYQTDEHPAFKNITMKLVGSTKDLLTFAVFGRDYTKDGLPVTEIMKPNALDKKYINYSMNQSSMESNSAVAPFQNFIGYVYNRIKFLLLVVSVYCLEQM